MKAIIGLGNPGPRYRHTRHNVGWHVLDLLASRWQGGKPSGAYHSEVVRCDVAGETVLLLRPQTMMNDSGRAARGVLEREHLGLADLLVIYDDIDLALGRLRVRAQGSAGGHNGIKSIQRELARTVAAKRGAPVGNAAAAGSAAETTRGNASAMGDPAVENGGAKQRAKNEPPPFARIKVGVGRPPSGRDPIEYVLDTFTPDELVVVRPAIERAAEAAEWWLREGVDATANRFNGA